MSNQLSNWFDNPFENQLYRVNGVLGTDVRELETAGRSRKEEIHSVFTVTPLSSGVFFSALLVLLNGNSPCETPAPVLHECCPLEDPDQDVEVDVDDDVCELLENRIYFQFHIVCSRRCYRVLRQLRSYDGRLVR